MWKFWPQCFNPSTMGKKLNSRFPQGTISKLETNSTGHAPNSLELPKLWRAMENGAPSKNHRLI